MGVNLVAQERERKWTRLYVLGWCHNDHIYCDILNWNETEEDEQSNEIWDSFPSYPAPQMIHVAHPITTEIPPRYGALQAVQAPKHNWKFNEEWCDHTKVATRRRGPAIAARPSGRAELFKERLDCDSLEAPETGVECYLTTVKPLSKITKLSSCTASFRCSGIWWHTCLKSDGQREHSGAGTPEMCMFTLQNAQRHRHKTRLPKPNLWMSEWYLTK